MLHPRTPAAPTRASSRRRSLLRDESGAALTEYVIILAFAGVMVAIGLATLGPKEVHSYSSRRAVLYDSQHP